MDDSVLKSVQTYLERNSAADYVQGEVKSISGNTAYVKIQGAERYQEAWLGKNSGLTTGDVCVMIRLKQASKWVIVSGYGTSFQGSDDTVVVQKGKSVAYFTTTTAKAAWTQVISVEFQKALADTSVVLSANVLGYRGLTAAAPWNLMARYRVNGVVSAFLPGVRDYYGGTHKDYSSEFSMNQLIPNLPTGGHTFSMDMDFSTDGFITVYVQMIAYEV